MSDLLKRADEIATRVGTHWEYCWQQHDGCLAVRLAARVRELEAERDALRLLVKDDATWAQDNEALRADNERLRDALAGVVGLVQLIASRDDLPSGLDDLMRLSHRMTDARAALAGVKHE